MRHRPAGAVPWGVLGNGRRGFYGLAPDMTRHRHLSVTGLVTAVVLALGVALASWAAAASGKGYDVSWPQCGGGPLPVDGDLGIVGVNGGKPFEDNPCLAPQYRWASTAVLAGPGLAVFM